MIQWDYLVNQYRDLCEGVVGVLMKRCFSPSNEYLIPILQNVVPVYYSYISKQESAGCLKREITANTCKYCLDVSVRYGAVKKKRNDEQTLVFEAAFIMLLYFQPSVRADLFHSTEQLLQKYPDFEDLDQQELHLLLMFRNFMSMALLIMPAKFQKTHLMDLTTRLCEGSMRKYCCGGGQSMAVTRRVQIYETEGGSKKVERVPRFQEIAAFLQATIPQSGYNTAEVEQFHSLFVDDGESGESSSAISSSTDTTAASPGQALPNTRRPFEAMAPSTDGSSESPDGSGNSKTRRLNSYTETVVVPQPLSTAGESDALDNNMHITTKIVTDGHKSLMSVNVQRKDFDVNGEENSTVLMNRITMTKASNSTNVLGKDTSPGVPVQQSKSLTEEDWNEGLGWFLESTDTLPIAEEPSSESTHVKEERQLEDFQEQTPKSELEPSNIFSGAARSLSAQRSSSASTSGFALTKTVSRRDNASTGSQMVYEEVSLTRKHSTLSNADTCFVDDVLRNTVHRAHSVESGDTNNANANANAIVSSIERTISTSSRNIVEEDEDDLHELLENVDWDLALQQHEQGELGEFGCVDEDVM